MGLSQLTVAQLMEALKKKQIQVDFISSNTHVSWSMYANSYINEYIWCLVHQIFQVPPKAKKADLLVLLADGM